MNKMTIIISTFIGLVLIAGGFLWFTAEEQPDDDQRAASPATTEPESQAAEPEAPTGEGFGDYIDYEEGAIEEAEGQVVLFFHAVWCPQCIQLERDIKQNGVPEGYTFIEVDFDQHQDLRQRYEVTVQTTLVRLDDNGDKIDSFVPYHEPTLEAVKRDFLDV